jgi:hypothetical protein
MNFELRIFDNKIAANNLKLLFIFLFLILTSCFLIRNSSKVYAQSLSLSISPPILEVMIKPGKTITQTYKITNTGDPIIMTPKIIELDEDGIKENPLFKSENWITILSSDLALNRPFLLDAKSEKQIMLKISPPQNSAEKNYYRVLLFATEPNTIANTTTSAITQNIGSVLLVNVTSSGILEKSAKISDFQLPKILDSFGPLDIKIDVLNTGKTYFRTIGKISLGGPLGKADFALNPAVIFENQKKSLTEESTLLKRKSEEAISLPGFYLGKYTVLVKFTLDESKTEIFSTKTFYAIPWKLGIVLLMIFIPLKILFFRKVKGGKHAKK